MKNFKQVRQGLTEERMNLSSRLYKQFKKDIDKIMKKHDAYVSDSNTKYTTISSPKPMKGGFKKDLFNLLGMTEEKELQETLSLLEKAYDDKDVKNVEKLEKKMEKLLKEVDKTMRGSGLSAPAFSMVRGGITKGLDQIQKFYKVAGGTKESVNENLQEGTWAVPDSYPKLVKLQNFLSKPHKAKTARDVHKFHIDADMYFGDDSFSDDLDAYKTILPGGEVSQYDKKDKYPQDYMDRMKKYNKIKPGTDLNLVLMKALSDWTGGVLKFKGNKIVQMPREWYMKDNPENKKDNSPVKAKLESEVKEKLSKKRPRGNLKMKRMEPIKVESLDETVKEYSDPSKSFPRDREWKKLVRKHKRHIKALQDKGKDLPSDAEEDFVSWGMSNGEIKNSDDIERFIEDELLNASYAPEGEMNLKELRKQNKGISEKYRSKFRPSDIAKAVEIALAMGGAMTPAVNKIEKIKKGLSDDPVVRGALRTANEGVNDVR